MNTYISHITLGLNSSKHHSKTRATYLTMKASSDVGMIPPRVNETPTALTVSVLTLQNIPTYPKLLERVKLEPNNVFL